MATGKPRIAILMAVYEPRMDWLREQLESLNAQDYPNLKLYVRDDCSPTVSFDAIQSLVRDCIHAFEFEIVRNEENLGSNGTFEKLTLEAEGDYFAYCDQDDVWHPEKQSVLQEELELQNASMAYCDMRVIDGAGAVQAQSLRKVRPRLRYLQGEGLAERYFFRNCTAGCCMLLRAGIAKEAIPFPKQTVCDHWLAICAAGNGRVAFLDRALMDYRIHGGNQTGILTGVSDAESYRKRRLLPLEERLAFYKERFSPSEELNVFINARLERRVGPIWKYRVFSPFEAMLEIVIGLCPKCLANWIIRRIG